MANQTAQQAAVQAQKKEDALKKAESLTYSQSQNTAARQSREETSEERLTRLKQEDAQLARQGLDQAARQQILNQKAKQTVQVVTQNGVQYNVYSDGTFIRRSAANDALAQQNAEKLSQEKQAQLNAKIASGQRLTAGDISPSGGINLLDPQTQEAIRQAQQYNRAIDSQSTAAVASTQSNIPQTQQETQKSYGGVIGPNTEAFSSKVARSGEMFSGGNELLRNVADVGTGALSRVPATIEFLEYKAQQPVSPIQFISPVTLLVSPEEMKAASESAIFFAMDQGYRQQVVQNILSNPGRSAGQVIGDIAIGKGLEVGVRGAVSDLRIFESITTEPVLTGERQSAVTARPLSESVSIDISAQAAGSSDQARVTVAQSGRQAAALLEERKQTAKYPSITGSGQMTADEGSVALRGKGTFTVEETTTVAKGLPSTREGSVKLLLPSGETAEVSVLKGIELPSNLEGYSLEQSARTKTATQLFSAESSQLAKEKAASSVSSFQTIRRGERITTKAEPVISFEPTTKEKALPSSEAPRIIETVSAPKIESTQGSYALIEKKAEGAAIIESEIPGGKGFFRDIIPQEGKERKTISISRSSESPGIDVYKEVQRREITLPEKKVIVSREVLGESAMSRNPLLTGIAEEELYVIERKQGVSKTPFKISPVQEENLKDELSIPDLEFPRKGSTSTASSSENQEILFEEKVPPAVVFEDNLNARASQLSAVSVVPSESFKSIATTLESPALQQKSIPILFPRSNREQTLPMQSNLLITKPSVEMTGAIASAQKTENKRLLQPLNIQTQAVVSTSAQQIAQRSQSATKPALRFAPAYAQTPITSPVSIAISAPIPPIRSPPPRAPSKLPIYEEPKLPLRTLPSEPKKKRPGFLVKVRRRGKFMTIANSLSESEAIAVGAKETRETAARTFRIEQAGTTEMQETQVGSLFDFVKKNTNTYIQKSKYSISSSGELSQITRKGQEARRKLRFQL